ncbi:phosphonate metabolism protein/1,5-bisphosphokinase (PRPP-forming) PhnN [uncultured Roseobacter sp.]|uniref:phosphonate metabolism protein/1,5-bisphosphokinase (PRPP-forming) PhnN n=1 Tax=uncultured Roseobacter sp. TaxID=114847 RepID=UPI00261CF539|nr:phosphonate metabolism protein/1,5-bisphosphokinase (PRPP-forming) PhnN [uncultured Roseobacter sp.]
MTGRFIAVVGPSGVGKDSFMQAFARVEPRLRLARRVITRPGDSGGEVFDGVVPDEFHRRQAAGAFALSWQAHGLAYGIPVSVDIDLKNGFDVLANLSRGALVQASRRFESFSTLALVARSDILEKRLKKRGREIPTEISRRLARADKPIPPGIEVTVLDNSGALAETVSRARDLLYASATTPHQTGEMQHDQ